MPRGSLIESPDGSAHRQSVAAISHELAIHAISLYKFRKAWRLQGKVVPGFQMNPVGCGPVDKFTGVLETGGLNATEEKATARSGARSLSRWSAGLRPPRIPTPSCY